MEGHSARYRNRILLETKCSYSYLLDEAFSEMA